MAMLEQIKTIVINHLPAFVVGAICFFPLGIKYSADQTTTKIENLNQTIQHFEALRVRPLEQTIANLQDQAGKTDTAFEGWRNKYAELLANYNTLQSRFQEKENTLKQKEDEIRQYQKANNDWAKQYPKLQKQNTELQQRAAMCDSNQETLREIRKLEKNKAELDNLLIASSREDSRWRKLDNEAYLRRQSDGYQNQILEYQKKLVCIPK
jgi:chromosome segregation ATPase